MKRNLVLGASAALAGAALFLVPTPARPAEGDDPLPWIGQETIEVELRTVPFYAVDAQGRPVYDLAPEEIELRVDGKPFPVETFDRYSLTPEGAAARASSPAPALPRHVFFLFDQVFSSPAGLSLGREAAEELLERLPASDRLYLITYHSQTGFRQELGPLPADAAGKAALARHLAELRPNIERLRTNVEEDLPSMFVGANTKHGQPDEQVHNFYDHLGGVGRSEYRAAAEGLAGAFEVLAAELGRLRGPKVLLVFSQGVERRMYFEGSRAGEGFGQAWMAGSGGYYHVDSPRFPAIIHRFEAPLRTLAAAGAVPVFVNAAGVEATGRTMMHHMSEVTGGLLLDNRNPHFLAERIVGATTAYYEAGFYHRDEGSTPSPERGRLEVVVKRPGVEAAFPGRLKARRVYRNLSDTERQLLIVDLVHRGLETSGERPSALRELNGEVSRTGAGDTRHLVFAPAFPPAVADKELDLYNVVLTVAAGATEAELERFDRRALVPSSTALGIANPLPQDGAKIWGIVAVEPDSGETYFRRFLLESPLAQQAKAARP